MSTSKSPRRSNTSKILEEKRVEDILNPKPLTLSAAGKEFRIYPMPDSSLMAVGDAINDSVGVILSFLDIAREARETGSPLLPEDFARVLPQLVVALIPHASRIIAGSLRLDEEWVATEMRAHEKLEALRLILQAEDIPLLLKNALALVEMIQGALPAEALNILDSLGSSLPLK